MGVTIFFPNENLRSCLYEQINKVLHVCLNNAHGIKGPNDPPFNLNHFSQAISLNYISKRSILAPSKLNYGDMVDLHPCKAFTHSPF
jgi:hypothetical protein